VILDLTTKLGPEKKVANKNQDAVRMSVEGIFHTNDTDNDIDPGVTYVDSNIRTDEVKNEIKDVNYDIGTGNNSRQVTEEDLDDSTNTIINDNDNDNNNGIAVVNDTQLTFPGGTHMKMYAMNRSCVKKLRELGDCCLIHRDIAGTRASRNRRLRKKETG